MRRTAVIFLAVIFLLAGAGAVWASSLTAVTSSLSGQVTWTAEAGRQVEEGDEIVRISTLVGEAAAARATVSGTVHEVLVKKGDMLSAGQIVAHIMEK